MLYNDNLKSKTGGADPFDKNKLVEEAKKDREKQEEIQKQQDRNKLQLLISNLERELSKLDMDLQTKKNLLSGLKLKTDDAKRNVFLLEGQIKKQEGGVGYLNTEAKVHDSKAVASESEVEKSKAGLELVEKERISLELKYNNNKINLNDLEVKIARLKDELAKMIAESDSLKKELIKNEAEINLKKNEGARLVQTLKSLEMGSKQIMGEKFRVAKAVQAGDNEVKEKKQELFLKKRMAEQFERDSESMAQEIAKLDRDKTAKEREINDLKRKRNMIG